MNAELTRKALEIVGNANVLVNLISRRVRQLNSGGGAASRPLVADTGQMGVADIALLEIVEVPEAHRHLKMTLGHLGPGTRAQCVVRGPKSRLRSSAPRTIGSRAPDGANALLGHPCLGFDECGQSLVHAADLVLQFGEPVVHGPVEV